MFCFIETYNKISFFHSSQVWELKLIVCVFCADGPDTLVFHIIWRDCHVMTVPCAYRIADYF